MWIGDSVRRKCVYCGLLIPDFTLEHVVPIRRGGLDIPTNHVMACFHCNVVKGDLTPAEWLRFVGTGFAPEHSSQALLQSWPKETSEPLGVPALITLRRINNARAKSGLSRIPIQIASGFAIRMHVCGHQFTRYAVAHRAEAELLAERIAVNDPSKPRLISIDETASVSVFDSFSIASKEVNIYGSVPV